MKKGWFWKGLAFTGIVIAAAQMKKDQEELERLREEKHNRDNKTLDELIQEKEDEINDEYRSSLYDD